jgi:hypothetical protein
MIWGGTKWIGLAQEAQELKALLNAVMILQIP